MNLFAVLSGQDFKLEEIKETAEIKKSVTSSLFVVFCRIIIGNFDTNLGLNNAYATLLTWKPVK